MGSARWWWEFWRYINSAFAPNNDTRSSIKMIELTLYRSRHDASPPDPRESEFNLCRHAALPSNSSADHL